MPIKYLLFGKRPERLEKAHHFVTLLIRLTIVIAILTAILTLDWIVLFVSSIAFILTFLPKIIERTYKVDIPIEFEILIVLFIYAAIFLGEVKSYYHRFWWWDAILHTGSGVALGFIGFAIMLILYRGKRINASPFTLALFSFSFAMAMGGVWEIFEFSMDQIVGSNMQSNGLVDTMWDLIVDALGALLASTLGYIYIKTGQAPIFDNLIKKFIKLNPELFK